MVHTAIVVSILMIIMLFLESNKKTDNCDLCDGKTHKISHENMEKIDTDNKVSPSVILAQNKELAFKKQLAEVKRLATIGEIQARAYEANTKRKISSLEEDLSKAIEEKKLLSAKVNAFPRKIDELVDIAKEISKKAEHEFESLLSKNKVLESNLSAYIIENNELKRQITDELAKEKLLLVKNNELEDELNRLKVMLSKQTSIQEEAEKTIVFTNK